jgi:hypothetical protein
LGTVAEGEALGYGVGAFQAEQATDICLVLVRQPARLILRYGVGAFQAEQATNICLVLVRQPARLILRSRGHRPQIKARNDSCPERAIQPPSHSQVTEGEALG